jgi:inositol transport system ATP-binding protein
MPALLEACNIVKGFSGIRVLEDVSLSIQAGEVHAILGENGAGKSTLMKILAGLYQPDAGEIRLRGNLATFRNPHEALRAGVAMIFQELLPFINLSVAENIFMGQEPASKRLGWINRRAMNEESERLLTRLGVNLDPRRPMRTLRVAEMQVVEIAKALAHQAELVIMDEPTSALSQTENEALFAIIRDLRSRGVAVVLISHKLDEVFQLADHVTVLRDGRVVATATTADVTPEKLIALMVGREPGPQPIAFARQPGAVALSVKRLGSQGHFRDVSFEVRHGEILGLAGLMGAGRTEILNAIYGLDPADNGEILVNGTSKAIRNTAAAIQAGIGLVTEDRQTFGLVSTMGVQRNLTLASLRRCCPGGFIDRGAERAIADEQIRALGIRCAAAEQTVDRLSGGNQQKVVFGRTLLANPEILLLDEPTRGIDVAAKAEVHALVRRLAADGKAIVLASSELPELFALSDRLLVLRQGAVAAELDPKRATAESVLKLAMPN